MSLYEHAPRTLLDRILLRPGRLTWRAQRRLARRKADDRYRAAARAQVVRVCRDCRHGVAPAGALNVSTALWQVSENVYLHVDPRACGYFIRYSIWLIAWRVRWRAFWRPLTEWVAARRERRRRRLNPDAVWAGRHPING